MRSCPDITELVGAEHLSEDHPLRQHLRACGRCRASLRAYEAFRDEAPGRDVTDAEVARADGRLAEYIETRMRAREDAPPAQDWSRGWMAMAAVLLVAVGLWAVGPHLTGTALDTGDRLRGDAMEAAPAAAPVTATVVAPGEVLIRWDPVAGAEDYEIILWTAALEEFARVGPLTGTEGPAAWDAEAEPGPVFFSVVSRQAGREIARSDLISLP
ncbi:MAG: hypothetical protein GY838_16365 [bacterium]|nr:hypothetical protein [bacterium]